MKFHVIDNETGKEADIYKIALKEVWAKPLMYCDMDGFYIGENGDLILADECGNYEFCDPERFKVVFGDKEYTQEMSPEQALEIVKEFPASLQDSIDHDGFGDTRFDKEQAKKDITALNMAIKALEFAIQNNAECLQRREK